MTTPIILVPEDADEMYAHIRRAMRFISLAKYWKDSGDAEMEQNANELAKQDIQEADDILNGKPKTRENEDER